jgi:hypothetical protein
MSVQATNIALTEGAKAHVREVAEVMATVGVTPRFDISYEGFGTGGTCNVPPEFALRFLTSLADATEMHARYRTRIKHISVTIRATEKTFTA